MSATKQKETGAHFTPPALSLLVAERLKDLMASMKGPLRVLDPACGDGNLLFALAQVLSPGLRRRVTLVGIENDPTSFDLLRERAQSFAGCGADLIQGDFLEFVDDGGLFGPEKQLEPVDVIVANPPYVRTQVLGANRAQRLASQFELTGRVDLYQAFLVAMSRQLRQEGILGVITSNRFLTTRAGASTRQILRTHFEILEIVDLGDTKLFDAAVLPALVFARKRKVSCSNHCSPPTFIRIYEEPKHISTEPISLSVTDLLRKPRTGLFRTDACSYRVSTGRLAISPDDSRPWTMLTSSENSWLDEVNRAAACRIKDVARVRVGIKTTADSVFVRRDWDELPSTARPDAEHLRPILSHDDAAKWRALRSSLAPRQVLYTHESVNGRRRAIPFDKRGTTWKYLLTHRERLESRTYVIEAGRAWYEIWVPHQPTAWAFPKIVFPDISLGPRFFFDRQGRLVDGNCYWITAHDPQDEDLLLLTLGVANSGLMARYHDLAFQNKLYSQRRRHLTQYVQEYPLPDRKTRESKKIVELVRQIVDESVSESVERKLEIEIDRLVCRAFGIEGELTDTWG